MKRVGAMAFILSGFVKDIVIMCTASHPLEAIQCVGGNSRWAGSAERQRVATGIGLASLV
jgi:hypothetical protein